MAKVHRQRAEEQMRLEQELLRKQQAVRTNNFFNSFHTNFNIH